MELVPTTYDIISASSGYYYKGASSVVDDE